jgi:UDP-N-acetylglucosamine---dolichyl-phosphate N-acetylglucosaminyltransferase
MKLAKRTLNKDDCYVVIAAYFEEQRIGNVLQKVKKQGFKKVIVVDDGSKDHTSAVAAEHGATVLTHVVNLGKGAAMKTGADYAREQKAKAIIFMDADGQHRPEELPLFLKELQKGYDIVFGYRKRTNDMPFVRRAGNWTLNVVVKLFYNMNLQDCLSGYRAVTVQAYDIIRWNSRDYSVESEMIARAGRNNLRYAQFQIDTIYHDKYKGMTIIDGIPIILNLIWWRMTH